MNIEHDLLGILSLGLYRAALIVLAVGAAKSTSKHCNEGFSPQDCQSPPQEPTLQLSWTCVRQNFLEMPVHYFEAGFIACRALERLPA